ncbi:MAG: wax ester/triacylglycerol synthase family O-acyltransferase, partial [Actinomycetes bacterium]
MFLSLETATTNGVLGGLVLFDAAPDGERGPDEAFMRRRITERLDLLPPLRWRRAEVPFELDHDYLVEADRIDVNAHIQTISLPSPGTREQLTDEVSRLMSVALVPGRPLWDLYVIEGLEDGGIAHLLRIHHGVLDGGSMPVLWDFLADEPVASLTPKWPRPVTPEATGGTAEMLVRGLLAAGLRPARFLAFQAEMTGWLIRRLRQDAGTTIPAVIARLTPGELAAPLSALLNLRQRRVGAPEIGPLVPTLRPPATPFGGKVSSRRSFVFADLPLDDFQRVRRTLGATLNDVVLAVCAGAVRRYLQSHGGVPDRPLIVCVPVSLRKRDDEFTWGNRVSMIFAPFPTHLEDPLERVQFARHAVQKAKANFDELPTDHLESASRFLPEAFFAVPAKLMSAAPEWVPTLTSWNVVVSNVRGPAAPAHVAGTRVRGYWPASFLSPNGGLNITLQSYVDRVDFGFVAAREHAEDLDTLPDLLEEALQELMAEADKVTVAAPKEPAGKTKPPTRSTTTRARRPAAG